jgi:RNA polymerase sigma-70 factor (ECF subfamily)
MSVPLASEGALAAPLPDCRRDPPAADALAPVARAALAGDARAQRRLCEAIAPALLVPLRMILGANHPDIEDVLQDALVGVLRGLPTFRWESSVVHFAKRVAAKRALEARRRARTVANTVDRAAEAEPVDRETPGDFLSAGRRRRHLRSLLDELPEAQAETLVMRAILGHSIEEIARVTEAPVNTVRSRLRLAKEALRSRIEGDPTLAELEEVAR